MKLTDITHELMAWAQCHEILPEQLLIQVNEDKDVFRVFETFISEFDPIHYRTPTTPMPRPQLIDGYMQFDFELLGLKMKFISKQCHRDTREFRYQGSISPEDFEVRRR